MGGCDGSGIGHGSLCLCLCLCLCLLPFAFCLLPFAFALCPLPFAFCLLPLSFALCLLPLELPFAFCLLHLPFEFAPCLLSFAFAFCLLPLPFVFCLSLWWSAGAGAVARNTVKSQKPCAKKSPHLGLIRLVFLAQETCKRSCKWWLWRECYWAEARVSSIQSATLVQNRMRRARRSKREADTDGEIKTTAKRSRPTVNNDDSRMLHRMH